MMMSFLILLVIPYNTHCYFLLMHSTVINEALLTVTIISITEHYYNTKLLGY